MDKYCWLLLLDYYRYNQSLLRKIASYMSTSHVHMISINVLLKQIYDA